jgi:hypothetical protein
MKSSAFVVRVVARTVLLAMTAFTLVVAVRVLGERPDPRPVEGCLRLPPGHPPVGDPRLPAGHPPLGGEARAFPVFPQDGTSTL